MYVSYLLHVPLFIFLLVPFMHEVMAASCTQPYDSGDWIIRGNLSCENVQYVIQGNITFLDDAVVTWRNVTLFINATSNGSHVIRSLPNAQISWLDLDGDLRTTNDKTKLVSLNPQNHYYIELFNPRSVQLRNVEIAHVGDRDLFDNTSEGRGLSITIENGQGKTIDIQGADIHDSSVGVYINGNPSSPVQVYATDNTLRNITYIGFSLNGVTNSTFERNSFDGVAFHRGIMCSLCMYSLFLNNHFRNAPEGGGMLLTQPFPNQIIGNTFGEGLLHSITLSGTNGVVVENNIFRDQQLNDLRSDVIALIDANNSHIQYNTFTNNTRGIQYYGGSAPETNSISSNTFQNNTWNVLLAFSVRDQRLPYNYWGTTNCTLIDDHLCDDAKEGCSAGHIYTDPILNAPYPYGNAVLCDNGDPPTTPRNDLPLYPWSNDTLILVDPLNDTSLGFYNIHMVYLATDEENIYVRVSLQNLSDGAGIRACSGSQGEEYALTVVLDTSPFCGWFSVDQYVQSDGWGNTSLSKMDISQRYNYSMLNPFMPQTALTNLPIAINCNNQSMDFMVPKTSLRDYQGTLRVGIFTFLITRDLDGRKGMYLQDDTLNKGLLRYTEP